MKLNLKLSIFIASIFSLFITIWLAVEYTEIAAFSFGESIAVNTVEIDRGEANTAVPAGESTHDTFLPIVVTPRVFLETFDGDPANPNSL